MTEAELPLNVPTVVADNGNMHVTATRLDQHKVRSVFRYPKNQQVVLDVTSDGSNHSINFYDKVFWTFSIDGQPCTESELGDFTQFSSFETSAEHRTMKLTRR